MAAIAAAAHACYASLPRKGKPAAHEYTIMSAVVATGGGGAAPRVVSLATGTKCVGARGVRRDGLALLDCHAEVLALRGLRRSLLLEVAAHAARCGARGGACALLGSDALLRHDGAGAFALRDGIALHLYISDSPCGDATRYADGGASMDMGMGGGGDAPRVYFL
jgi:tRNA-specific adenosine deaminase 1